MRQPRYQSLTTLLAAGTQASSGGGAHAVALDLEFGTKAAIDGLLNPLLTQRDGYEVTRAELATLRGILLTKQQETYDLLQGSRDLLKRSLGKKYSAAWAGTGFSSSLAVPRSVARLQSLAGTLKAYLTANPALERPNLMTALLIGTALEDLTAEATAVKLKESALGTLLTGRRQKEKQLRRHLRWVVDELGRKIEPLDDRWTAFGFNKPGLKETPERPEKVTVARMGTGWSVKWRKSPRAEYYRIWVKVVGTNQEAVWIGNASDLDFMIESLPPGANIEVSVSASNNGGESARSEVVAFTSV